MTQDNFIICWAKQENNKPPQKKNKKQSTCIEIKQLLAYEINKMVIALVYKLSVHLTYTPTGPVPSRIFKTASEDYSK